VSVGMRPTWSIGASDPDSDQMKFRDARTAASGKSL